MPYRGLRFAISAGVLVIIIVRLMWPDLKIDIVTLGLIAVLILPWVSTIIKSAEFPGGWKVEFQEVQTAGAKITKDAPEHTTAPRPSYIEILDKDPNLAIVGLRIEIEKRLRNLADKYQIKNDRSLIRIFDELRKQSVLNDSSVSGLQELIMAGNQAAHGATVDVRAATWAIEFGPRILAALDDKLAD